jgi:sarcosine oxidase
MAYDVVVLGLGGMGSAPPRTSPPAASGCSGSSGSAPRTTGAPATAARGSSGRPTSRTPAYVPLLRRAYELWERAEKDTGTDLMTLGGGIYLGRPDSALVAGSLASARRWDLPHELLDAREIRRRFPTLAPADDDVGLFEAVAGFVRPEAAVGAHLVIAARHGAELHFDEPATGWSATGDGVHVATDRGTYTAERLVVCPGAWAPQVLADLRLPLTVERQVLYWFAPDGGTGPYEQHPIWIHERTDGLQLYGFPAIDGPDGGVKTAFFRRGSATTADALDRAVHEDEIEDIAAHLRAVVPTLPGRCCGPRRACTRRRRTTTSSSPGIPRTSRWRWPAGSPGTGSSSCRWWGRSWPTW